MSLDSETPSLNFDVTKTTPVVCKCGNHTFTHGAFLREVSALVSPNGKQGILPVPVFVCNACGTPPDQVVPQFIKLEGKKEVITDTSSAPATPGTPFGPISKGGLTLLP